MFRWLIGLDKESREARKLALQYVADTAPDASVYGASLRADEPSRWVFAVFYTTPQLMIKPMPYRLISVSKSSRSASELPQPPESPYCIRGRK
ncbi:hypothetical protein Pan181_12030 [Aeoliella mucimassa]|uniref:Uncharacterized protein n=1 Tax=Aeoliella mucimassa TaxID=2527972 RepID=A0A518AJW0_9BACT|nr:hypothetical protein Pan181_12030 [Aeoliella mucimassa]